MFEWVSEHFSDALKQNIDYILLSYYEDDNEGYKPEWKQVFSNLEKGNNLGGKVQTVGGDDQFPRTHSRG